MVGWNEIDKYQLWKVVFCNLGRFLYLLSIFNFVPLQLHQPRVAFLYYFPAAINLVGQNSKYRN